MPVMTAMIMRRVIARYLRSGVEFRMAEFARCPVAMV